MKKDLINFCSICEGFPRFRAFALLNHNLTNMSASSQFVILCFNTAHCCQKLKYKKVLTWEREMMHHMKRMQIPQQVLEVSSLWVARS